jgi:hypothetical protein
VPDPTRWIGNAVAQLTLPLRTLFILQSREAADPWTSGAVIQLIKFASSQSDAYSSPNPHAIHRPATMTLDGETETRLRTIHLDGTLLELDPEEEAFFKAETGIQDTENLKKHIIEVQEEAYKVSGYSCANWVH